MFCELQTCSGYALKVPSTVKATRPGLNRGHCQHFRASRVPPGAGAPTKTTSHAGNQCKAKHLSAQAKFPEKCETDTKVWTSGEWEEIKDTDRSSH